MQVSIKPNVLQQCSQLLEEGRIKALDSALMNHLFFNTDGDGITTKRYSRNTLASLLQTTVYQVRRALRRLESAGLLARADLPYKGKGTIWQVVGKAIYKKIKQRENQRKQHRAQKRRGKRSYARLEGQTVRRPIKKAAPPKPEPVLVMPEPTDEEKAIAAKLDAAKESGGMSSMFSLMKSMIKGGK